MYSSSIVHDVGSCGYSKKSARSIGQPFDEESFACAKM